MNQTVSSVAEDYFSYNAMLNLLSEDGQIQFDKDKIAVRQYFLQHVNKNMVFFHDLQEKLDYLVDNQYYEKELLDKYHYEDIKKLFKSVYAHKFRFASFQGAYKFYKQYALKTNDGQRYLERLEDRVAMAALYLGDGNISDALDYSEEIISGRYQPATPTFLSAGRKQRGEPVSCFPAGTKILTSTGSKDIEDIEVGDKVLTHTGKYQPVEKLNKRLANEKLHAIKAVGHPEFYCTPEHPILIWSSDPNDKRKSIIEGDGANKDLKWIAAKDIKSETDYIVTTGSKGDFKTYKVLVNAVSKENYNDYVYNLHVKDDHTYQVNGVIVHNCFLINVPDDMESIARSIGSALQLSKRGGGVALCLTDVREAGAPIKGIDGAAAGLVPVMKLYEDGFSYADQLG